MQPSFVSPPVPGRGRPVVALLAVALRRPGARRVLSAVSALLLVASGSVLAYPVATDAYGAHRQAELQSQLQAQLQAVSTPTAREVYRTAPIAVGRGVTRLRVPRIGLQVLVVQGTSAAALRAGAGHYVETPLPGELGNVGIAGHRTTYGRPLNRLDQVRPGDLAELETPLAVHTYRAVEPFDGHPNPWVVLPTDVAVLAAQPGERLLTLTTCHPKGSARQRLVMRFALVSSVPTDTALRPAAVAPAA